MEKIIDRSQITTMKKDLLDARRGGGTVTPKAPTPPVVVKPIAPPMTPSPKPTAQPSVTPASFKATFSSFPEIASTLPMAIAPIIPANQMPMVVESPSIQEAPVIAPSAPVTPTPPPSTPKEATPNPAPVVTSEKPKKKFMEEVEDWVNSSNT